MMQAYQHHTSRFPYRKDPEIEEILLIAPEERTRACIARFVARGMDVLDMLSSRVYFDPWRQRTDLDEIALLKAGLVFCTAEGLNRTADAGVPGERGRTAVWVSIVQALSDQVRDMTGCLEALRDAGADLEEFTDDDAAFNDYFVEESTCDEIRRLATRQRVERERTVLDAAAESAESMPSVARRRL